MRRQTIDEIKTRSGIINPKIKILSDEYGGSKAKILCRCKVCGHEWSVIWQSLQQGKGCPKCSGHLRKTMADIKSELFVLNHNIEIKTEVYLKNSQKLDMECHVCGYEWRTTWACLQQGCGCPRCSNRLRLTLEQIREQLDKISPTITITSEEYVNNSTNLDLHCEICGHNWNATWQNLAKGKGCPKCSGRFIDYDNIVSRLAIISPTITILDTEYILCDKKINVKCDICGHEWSPIWESLQQGKGCPKCALEKRSGENHPGWKGGIAPIKEYLRGSILQWKKDSSRDCKYKCVISGDKFDHIHHIHNFSAIVYEAFDICAIPHKQQVIDYTEQELLQLSIVCNYLHDEYGLGKCLTKELHKEFHSTYGYKNNTLEQFEEFVELKRKEMGLKLGNL